MVTYGGTAIPQDQITVLSGGTVSVSVAFENTVGLIGGMDTDEGSATPGEVVQVSSPSDAESKFGEDSELHEQVELAFLNDAGEVYALPVDETTETESFESTSSDSLSDAPVFDPNLHDEEEITAQDTSEGEDVDVEIVYGEPSEPSESNTINLNPVTGEWEADESSSYEITYTYGDYGTDALSELVDMSPRIIGVLTENTSVINDLLTEVKDRATDFDFMHVVAGASPVPDPSDTSTYVSDYDDSFDERRLSLVSPARGYRDSAEDNEQRVVGAISGLLASLALGLTSTNKSIGGFASLRADFPESEAGSLIDSEVLPLLDKDGGTIAKDNTTSEDEKFGRVAWMQIIDEVTEASHQVARSYIGDQMTNTTLNNIDRSHRNFLKGMRSSSPRLVEDYTVSVSQNDSEPNQADVDLGIQVVKYVDYVNVTITVGDIIRNEGTN